MEPLFFKVPFVVRNKASIFAKTKKKNNNGKRIGKRIFLTVCGE